jgi:hypothetical protein
VVAGLLSVWVYRVLKKAADWPPSELSMVSPEFSAHCSTKWAVFLLSLKDLLEKDKGQSAPDDVAVNHD